MNAKKDLFERSLHRAAELIGDITAPALKRFLAGFPEADRAFTVHSRGDTFDLAGTNGRDGTVLHDGLAG